MTDPSPSEAITVSNDRSLKKLAWAIAASGGQFKLILARCNHGNLRSRLVQRLQELCSVEIRVLVLKESDTILYATIRAALGENMPAALMVLGLESVRNLEQMLTSSNQVREEFRKNLPFPLVLWVNDEVLKNWMRLASDFESWATTVTFVMAPEDLENQLRDTAEQWFTNNLTLTLEACLELEAAYKELLKDERGLNPDLEADCESLLGFSKRVNHQIDAAIEHYQRGLVFWRQTHNLERQAKLLDEIAFCYYLKAPHRHINHPICQDIKDYVQEYLRVIEQIQRPDLMANSILRFGEVLGYLQDWEQLKRLAQQALSRHEAENKPIELARDYGFLAEAALAQERWKEANQYAQKALDVLSVTSKIPSPGSSGVLYELPDKSVLSYDPSLYLFILAKSQQSLGQSSEAIRNLEVAREVESPECDPQVYLDILCHLQQLYFQEKDYLKAFEIKQNRQSIEQQYGLRAFIGAGRIQSQRQARLALKQVVETGGIASLQESVAPEITASGRQLDVERLIERIARNDCKLIVIHGESGVGKSSLVAGGLVPALKQKAIGTSDVLPVLMRVYTSWVGELGRLLAEALEEKGRGGELVKARLQTTLSNLDPPKSPLKRGTLTDSDPPKSLLKRGTLTEFSPLIKGGWGGSPGLQTHPSHESNSASLDLVAGILEELQQSESRNLRIVLIFDQFEEFFFVYPDPVQQRQFFEFVGECLNILPVKVILSLREDYLHYLLECDRLDSMKIIGNDILTRNVRYPLGNFSAADAKVIIQQLTERSYFHLEPALIEELVQDLAGELGKVRPIELQIVGAQLQTENITTLTQYRECGQKVELVKRYLAEVVKDCGAENQQVAELVLYLLTDEKGTRPLKTRAEVERDLQALASADLTPEVNRLDLVFKIFVDSGLVVLLKEFPADRYQLVHDYLAEFIRQQQEPKLNELMAELERERKQRQLSDEKLNQFLKRALIGSVAAVFGFAFLAIQADTQRKKADINEIEALTNSSEAFFASERTFDALIEGLKAGGKIKHLDWATADTRIKIMAALRQVVYLPADYGFREHNSLEKHSSPVTSVSFSPDGKTIASASYDHTVKLWNLQGKEITTFKGYNSPVTSVSFSPDGKTIVSVSDDKTVKFWNRSGELVPTFKGNRAKVYSVSFSPDGRTIASASADNTIKLWNRSGELLQTFQRHSAAVSSVSFSPDGKMIASASDDNTIKLWSLEGEELVTLKGHSAKVYSVSFSPDGKTIASASEDKTVKLWNLQGKELTTFKGHSAPVSSVSFNPDGRMIASASWDNTIKLWNLSGELLQTLKGHRGTVTSISFSPDGNTIASASWDHTVKLWNLQGKEPTILKGHSAPVSSVSFSPDRKTIASASEDKTVKLWNYSGKLLHTLKGHSSTVISVSFSPDGQTIASASDDKTVKLWNLQGQLLHTLKEDSGFTSVSFSPDGRTIASASFDHTVKLWNLQGKKLAILKGHRDRVRSVSFSPDGKTIASASYDHTVKLWNLQGKELVTFEGHSTKVYSVSFSPDGKTIASASEDKTVKLWNLQGKELATLKGHGADVPSVSFSPDGKTIASASFDYTVKLWNLQGKELTTLKGHNAYVYSVSFSPDGKTIASASRDNTVILWNFDLDDLLRSGCHWLNDYLVTHPDVLKELKECQTP